jgi:hypothetical protein
LLSVFVVLRCSLHAFGWGVLSVDTKCGKVWLTCSVCFEKHEIRLTRKVRSSFGRRHWWTSNKTECFGFVAVQKKDATFLDLLSLLFFRLEFFSRFLAGNMSTIPPLIDAAMNGKQSDLEKLLSEGADPNAKTAGGLTALHWAVIRGHFGIVKALANSDKIDLKARTPSGMTPLDEALVRGRLNVVKLLDEKGVNIVSEPNFQGTRCQGEKEKGVFEMFLFFCKAIFRFTLLLEKGS